MRCKLLSGTHTRQEGGAFVKYGTGDILEMNEIEIETHKHRIEVLGVEDLDVRTHQDSVLEEDLDISTHQEGILDKPYREVIAEIKLLDDSDIVRGLWDLEQDGKNRPSVIAVLRNRVAELEE